MKSSNQHVACRSQEIISENFELLIIRLIFIPIFRKYFKSSSEMKTHLQVSGTVRCLSVDLTYLKTD